MALLLGLGGYPLPPPTKKADVINPPLQEFNHVGLLFNEAPGWAGLLFA
jgi:hypothetical protein